ncbi:hypothetical protein NC651_013547 [Populus alba x Populus x berolinensis]|nr:hypothetical protein NC651_013547 [Populus alba x Populus x berolinensis]
MASQFEASEDEGVMEERAASFMVLFFARAFLKRCLASDYRLVAPNRAKSLELSFYTVVDAMLVELQSRKLVEQISEI